MLVVQCRGILLAMAYFSERERGPSARVSEDIGPAVWQGIWALITTRLQDGSFGASFPETCPDNYGVVGHAPELLAAAALGDGIAWPIEREVIPDVYGVMDLLEFCWSRVARPVRGGFHDFFGHYHLSFDAAAGRATFRLEVNRIFERQGVAFEMDDEGQMIRLGPPELHQSLKATTFSTGDVHLDALLEDARDKYLDPDVKVRKDGLEKLWDAFERLKTIEPGQDKKESIAGLLGKAFGDTDLRDRVNAEMQELTAIGNTYMIRHTEIGKKPVEASELIDYLFQRMFAVIRLLLVSTNRADA